MPRKRTLQVQFELDGGLALMITRRMDEGHNSWLAAAENALAPKEQAALGKAGPGESVVDHLIRIARLSRRAKARQAAMGALLPAARDRLPGVVELALDLLHDASRWVRYEACRALAVALAPATLPQLQKALNERLDVPWNGVERAIRAVRTGRRNAFHENPERTHWVLQDEEWDHEAQCPKILGSSAYGTTSR
jgi:hypothetical protein